MVKVFELEPITMGDGVSPVLLRIEILKWLGGPPRFTARVWRLDRYRVLPTFPQRRGRPALDAVDEGVLVIDENFAEELSAASSDAALRQVLREIRTRFFPKQARARSPTKR